MTDQKEKFILTLDEGTSTAKAFIFNKKGNAISSVQCTFDQYYPKPGWVEQNPLEIWIAQRKAIKSAMNQANIKPDQIESIGITNQRETTVLWEKKTGKPIHNAIVWQDRRTSDIIESFDQESKDFIKNRSGLIPDAYFSASKIQWMLEHIPDAKKRAKNGELLFGTIDSYLLYKLTDGRIHATDHSNACRTMLYNINSLQWDTELLELFKIPACILPEINDSSSVYGETSENILREKITISGCAGDQQAALFGQRCFHEGMVKNTFGTGNFLLMNTGSTPVRSKNLLTTIAWVINGHPSYALEGSVFVTGAAVQWLKDIGLIDDIDSIGHIARSVPYNQGVYFIPAFAGLGAPYWDQYARGTIIGITQGTKKGILIRAALESICYLSQDILEEMQDDSGISIKDIHVDGGGTTNEFLLQYHADISNKTIMKPSQEHTTALGAAFLAGLSVDYWENINELADLSIASSTFKPNMDNHTRERLYNGWKKAIMHSKDWKKELDQCGTV